MLLPSQFSPHPPAHSTPVVTSVLTHTHLVPSHLRTFVLAVLSTWNVLSQVFVLLRSFVQASLNVTSLEILPWPPYLKWNSPTLIPYLLLLFYFSLPDILVLNSIINIYSWPSVTRVFAPLGLVELELTDTESRFTGAILYKELEHFGFWYPWRS